MFVYEHNGRWFRSFDQLSISSDDVGIIDLPLSADGKWDDTEYGNTFMFMSNEKYSIV